MWNCISHSFNKYLYIHCVPGTILGTADTAVNKTSKNPCPQEACIPVREKEATKTLA